MLPKNLVITFSKVLEPHNLCQFFNTQFSRRHGEILFLKIKKIKYYINDRKSFLVYLVIIHVKSWKTKRLKSHHVKNKNFRL